jgi:hypothetical protein
MHFLLQQDSWCILVCLCLSHPLLSLYGLEGLQNPQSGNDLPYCNGLKEGQTCCSSQTVTTFQDQLNELTERLHNFAAARDLYLAQIKERYVQLFRNALGNVDFGNPGSIFNLENFVENIGDQIEASFDIFNTVASELGNINDNFYASLRTYQQSRTNCFSTVLKAQASAWCLACDPNYATKGVSDDGTIAFSDNLCQTITSACYPFLEQSVNFNPLIRARQSLEKLRNIQAYANNNDDTDGDDDTTDGDDDTNDPAATNVPAQENVFNPISSQKTVTIPEGCSGEGCSWQCQNLFAESKLDELLLANGAGPLGGADVDLTPIGEGTDRILQDGTSGTWNPDLEATALQFNVVENPGDVYFSDDDDTDDPDG